MDLQSFHQFAGFIRDPLLLVTERGDIVARSAAARSLFGDDTTSLLPDAVADPVKLRQYLSLCSSTRQPLPGAITSREGISHRVEGALVQPAAGQAPALLLLRLRRDGEAIDRFVTLNEKIKQLSAEIRERRAIETLLQGQNAMLELVLQAAPLRIVLDELMRAVEKRSADGMLCSILLLDSDGQHLRHGAAPSLPTEYSAAIDGVRIGERVGSCGTAAFRREPVIVSDIASDPLWADFRDLALLHGLRACWSTPIFASSGELLGTFAVYYRQPRSSSSRDSRLIEIVTRTAAIAIERSRAEMEIRFQSRLLDAVEEAVIATDLEGRIVYWNRFAEKLYGWTAERVLQRNIGDVISSDPISIRRGGDPRASWSEELELTRNDGTTFPAQVTGAPIYDPDGNLIGIVEVSTDITLRRQADEERERLLASEKEARAVAERASRLKDEFLATLSHELRTPLTSVLGWVRILLLDPRIEGETREALEIVARSSRQQAQMIEELLDVSRIITGKLTVEVRPVDLAGVVGQAMNTVAQTAAAKAIRLEKSIEAEGIAVNVDPDRMQQVLWNLLSNAIKFSPKGSEISVRVGRVGSTAEVSVIDQGSGIDPEFLPHVFERFSQADSSKTRVHGGLGLGLSIVRHLVEIHGGTVRAQSDGPGAGATFTVTLPIVAMKAAEEPPMMPAPAMEALPPHLNLRGVRLLVVEDDAPSRYMLQSLFTRSGATVMVAASMEEALRHFEMMTFDVLLSDIAMPGGDGYELLRAIRRRESNGRHVPAIALTAHAHPADREHALQSGFEAYVAKPVTPEELIMAVASVSRPRPEH